MRPAYRGIGPGRPNPLILGRKFCAECGRWKLAHEFRPDRHNIRSGLRSYCLTCERMRHRAHTARMSAAQRELKREYQRFWTEAQRRAAGTPPRKWGRRRTRADKAPRVFLPAAPLVKAMRYYVQLNAVAPPRTGIGGGWDALAGLAGTDARSLHRLRTGESPRVRLDLADRVAVAIGVPLTLIYPPEDQP